MNDRNKSPLTHDVTAATVHWLEGRGMKPVETEVSVERGWCADLAAVWCPTMTELIEAGFIKRRPGWNDIHSLKRSEASRLAAAERLKEWNVQYEGLERPMTCLVEVKTSRGDFRGDRKWTSAWPTDLAYVVVPKGMISEAEWPVGWGILEHSENGIRRLRNPIPAHATLEQHRDVMLNIAIRRDHHTRFERWRDLQKRHRAEDAEEKSLRRITDITRMVLRIAKGEFASVAEALDRNNVKKLDRWSIEQLEELRGIAVTRLEVQP